MAETPIPTYATIAGVLAKQNGSGWRLAGWTVARTILIAPPFAALGVDTKKVVLGSLLASSVISLFTYLRLYDATHELGGASFPQRARRLPAARRRRR
jgi:hypothetical protein